MCFIPFDLLPSSHYYEPASPQELHRLNAVIVGVFSYHISYLFVVNYNLLIIYYAISSSGKPGHLLSYNTAN
jgi:hypothetical protein